MLIASAIVSGLGLGSMYGLLALGFHVTHAVSRTVNFAQGSTMMLGAVLCFTFWVTLGWPLALAVVLALAAGLQAFFATSRHGKALLAVVQNRDAARLMGIRVERVVEAAFALSGLLAGIAGILVAPLFTISSTMGALFGIKAFAVAILGGIESAWGVVLGGLIYGVAEALITALLGSTYTQIVTFALVILALALRPHGLFGRAH